MPYPIPGALGYTAGNDVVAARRFLATADGTAGAPAFSFVADPDNGMYRGGTNDLRMSSAGSIALSSTSAELAFFNHTRIASGNFSVTGGYIQLTEMAAPGAGAANTVRIYAVVDGGTLTDAAAVFQDGTVDIFAQEV